MERSKISLMIGLLGVLALTAAAQASEPQATPTSDPPATAQAETKTPPLSDAHCLRHTGTRIAVRADSRTDARADSRKARTCSNGTIGRAYTRDDLDRTGRIDIADALRALDPSIH